MTELNLIPYELRRKSKGVLNKKQRIILISVLIFIVLIGVIAPILKHRSLAKEDISLLKEIKAGQNLIKESDALKVQIDKYKAYILVVDELKKVRPDAAEKVKSLEKYAVSDVVFQNLTWGEGQITIQANSKSYESLCAFVANLQESGEYKKARMSGIINGSQSGYNCSISIEY